MYMLQYYYYYSDLKMACKESIETNKINIIGN